MGLNWFQLHSRGEFANGIQAIIPHEPYPFWDPAARTSCLQGCLRNQGLGHLRASLFFFGLRVWIQRCRIRLYDQVDGPPYRPHQWSGVVPHRPWSGPDPEHSGSWSPADLSCRTQRSEAGYPREDAGGKEPASRGEELCPGPRQDFLALSVSC